MRRAKPAVTLLMLLIIALVLTVPGEAAQQPAPAQKAALPPAPIPPSPPTAVIPLADVAIRAAALFKLLPTLSAQLAPSASMQAIMMQLPDISDQIGTDLAGMPAFLEGQPPLAMLAAREQVWNTRQAQIAEWLKLLTEEGGTVQQTLTQLETEQTTWRDTRTAAQTAKAPEEVLQQIDAVLAALDTTIVPFRARHTTVLGMQSRVAQEVTRCGVALTQLAEAQQRSMSAILVQDSPPIWTAGQWDQARTALPARIRGMVAGYRDDLRVYAHDVSRGLPRHAALFMALLILMGLVRRRVRHWDATGEESIATSVFERPYAAALLVTLVFISSPYSAIPVSLRNVARALALLPVIRLAQPAMKTRLPWVLYAQTLLFALDMIRQRYGVALGPEQAMLGLEMLAGIGVLGHIVLTDRWNQRGWAPERVRRVRMIAGGVLGALGIGLTADLFGYMRLARLLASAVLGSGALALMLYASLQVLVGVTAVALRVWPLRLLHMVQHHRDLLERRTHTALCWVGIYVWLARTLDYVGFWQPALALGTGILTARLHRGAISLSLGDILDFVLTLWVAYLVSVFVRFVLHEDVYPHLRLPRGVSYALSSLLNYSIVAVGFLLGLAALGLDLTKMTVLAGAFGVGIGFGLQTVVNNFISGLILLFERPIQVGDSIVAGDLTGQVRRIGIRASVVRTGEGADMIVPNAQLITDRVLNWTLHDRLRRIDVPVGVSYGTPPEKVIEILETVARTHPDVLHDPAPEAFFTGFGDSALTFELRAWTDQSDRWFKVRSLLATAVYKEGIAAGLSFPFPQREVRILHGVGAPDSASPLESRKAPELSV
jgi:small-conductance mechanosensitive channel